MERLLQVFALTIVGLKGADWLDNQFGRNNWTSQQLAQYPDSCGDFWCEDDLFDLININDFDYEYTLQWLDDNRDWWRNI